MIASVLHILFVALFVYLSINIIYLVILAIAGRVAKQKKYLPSAEKKRIAVLIPSYNEDAVIINTAHQAVHHDYPKDKFDVLIAADHLSSDTISALNKLDCKVYPVHFEKGSKARSLNYLLNAADENSYDIALVLDGDNVMASGFLEKINSVFQKGFRAAQAHRTAKNKDSSVAILDAVSEEINNHLFRRSQRALGLSASTIGSGMAFEFRKLKDLYNKPGIVDNPACDREVDFEMMRARVITEYVEDATLFDEKVATSGVFKNQRRRWLESQIIHLRLFFKEHVAHKDRNFWNKLFINLLPPRIILLAVFIFVFAFYGCQLLFRFDVIGMPLPWWLLLFFLYMFSMLISIPASHYNRRTAAALLYLPVVLFAFLKAAFGVKSGRKEFVHTPKTYTGSSKH